MRLDIPTAGLCPLGFYVLFVCRWVLRCNLDDTGGCLVWYKLGCVWPVEGVRHGFLGGGWCLCCSICQDSLMGPKCPGSVSRWVAGAGILKVLIGHQGKPQTPALP